MTTTQQAQNNAKAMAAFAKDNAVWMQLSLAAVNAWGRGEGILQHLVAEAIKEAHALGLAGETPEFQHPVQHLIKRSRPAPPKPAIIRRTR